MSDTLATINLILGIIGFSWLLVRTVRRWREYPDEIQMLLTLALTLFFGLLAVSTEVLAADDGLTASVGVITVVKVFALIVLWRTSGTLYRTGARAPFSGDEHNVNKDLLDEGYR